MKKNISCREKNIFFHENNSQDFVLRHLERKIEGYYYSLVNTVLAAFIDITRSHYPR